MCLSRLAIWFSRPSIDGCLSGQTRGSWCSLFPYCSSSRSGPRPHQLCVLPAPTAIAPCCASSAVLRLLSSPLQYIHCVYLHPLCFCAWVRTSTFSLPIRNTRILRFNADSIKASLLPFPHCFHGSKIQKIQEENMEQKAFSRFKLNISGQLCAVFIYVVISSSVAPVVHLCSLSSCATPVFVHWPPHLSDTHVQTSYMVCMFVSQSKYLISKGITNITWLPFSFEGFLLSFSPHHTSGAFTEFTH